MIFLISHLFIFRLDLILRSFYKSLEKKNQYYFLRGILLVLSTAFMRNDGVITRKRKILCSSSESIAMKRERSRRDRGRGRASRCVKASAHTFVWWVPDNRHCAPAITRNRTRQHHAGIVRVSASILLFSRFLLLHPDSLVLDRIFRLFRSNLHKSLPLSFTQSYCYSYNYSTPRLLLNISIMICSNVNLYP